MSISKEETQKYIEADIYRNLGTYSKSLQRKISSERYSTVALLYYYRLCHYYSELPKRNLFQFISHAFCYLRFKKLQYNCGVEMNQHMKIGYGLRLPHKGTIIFHPQAVIGNNCEIMQGVTLGNNILKDIDAVPVIGDEVLICAGAKVIGGVKVNNNVVIGANSVVNMDVPSNSVVAGVPAKVVGSCKDEFVLHRHDIV